MTKKTILVSLIAGVLVAGGAVVAQGIDRGPATVLPSGQTVIVPDQAIDNSAVLERVIFIHYKDGKVKPVRPPRGGAPACYGFLAKGAKLKTTENLVISPDLDLTTILNSTNEWDSHTSTTLFGSYTIDPTANWDSLSPDGRNEFSFGNYSSADVIAVTVVWGYFSGPGWMRQITEFVVLFDTDYVWGDVTINPLVMDLENIAVHEIGHGVGLKDIYDTACGEVTMYGYSTEGETSKRTLEAPDINGLQEMYGI